MVPLLDGIGGVLGVNVVSEASGWEGKGEMVTKVGIVQG